METHIAGVAGSQNEPFYDLLHPNQSNSNNINNISSGLIKQMDDLGFEKDIVVPSFTSQPIKTDFNSSSSSSLAGADLQDNSPRLVRQRAPSPSYSPAVHSASDSLQAKWEHDKERFEAATLAAVERTMKKHGDNLLRALEGISGRLTQLENKTQHLEGSVEELKMSVSKSHGETDGRMRMLENLLREVQTGVQVLRDKQEIAEARSQLMKSQSLKNNLSDNTFSHENSEPKPIDPQQQPGFAGPHQAMPSFSFPSQPQASLSAPAQNLPLPRQAGNSPQFPSQNVPALHPQQVVSSPPFPAPQAQQSVPVQAHSPSPLGAQQVLPSTPSVPSEPSYQSALHQSSAPPPPPPQPHQYQIPSHMQQVPPNAIQMPSYSQNPQPQQPSKPVSLAYSQPDHAPNLVQHVPHSQMSAPVPQGNYGPEPPYVPANYGGPSLHQQPQPIPPPQQPAPQRYTGGQQAYEPSFGRTSSGPLPFTPNYGPGLSGPTYGDSQSYSAPPYRSSHQDSAPSGGSGHPRLPTAKPLQHSLPVASSISGSPSGSPSSSNRVPVDDVIDKVASMGFSKEQVKAVVRKLTENGQSVDLNIVLDKLMNSGEIQPQKGWFGR
ncbi:hypothetical protein SUGI_0805340 [Cryptomeria japonica]|uniref:uncharacterized protein LOC131031260 n=1 Tax=Cryptomeria japonica TaxID=3369 RepID=UPI002414B4D1|nr:uncharacterized protein LOC131031260 [Cryptomeria japonica]GLJ39427.1 hypothetical protein SUGI_0805340 [Cryptomeria japonica]